MYSVEDNQLPETRRSMDRIVIVSVIMRWREGVAMYTDGGFYLEYGFPSCQGIGRYTKREYLLEKRRGIVIFA
jgi:hypothetical protein